jgi:hypothetical protein
MAQPAPKPVPVDFDALMMRVADEVGIEKDEIRNMVRTVQWGGHFEVGKPLPGKLSNLYLAFAMFHGCKNAEETRVAGEQRIYAAPAIQGAPFLRLTYVPGWGDHPRHETMGGDAFVEEVAAEFASALDLDGDTDECPKCGADVGDDAEFCASCGEKIPEEAADEGETTVDPDATIVPPPS